MNDWHCPGNAIKTTDGKEQQTREQFGTSDGFYYVERVVNREMIRESVVKVEDLEKYERKNYPDTAVEGNDRQSASSIQNVGIADEQGENGRRNGANEVEPRKANAKRPSRAW